MALSKENTCNLTAIKLQTLPTESPKGAQDVKNTGYWPRVAEIHTKRMISASPDSWTFPYIEKD